MNNGQSIIVFDTASGNVRQRVCFLCTWRACHRRLVPSKRNPSLILVHGCPGVEVDVGLPGCWRFGRSCTEVEVKAWTSDNERFIEAGGLYGGTGDSVGMEGFAKNEPPEYRSSDTERTGLNADSVVFLCRVLDLGDTRYPVL